MATSPTFDADKLRASSQQLRDAAAIYAGKVAVKVADLDTDSFVPETDAEKATFEQTEGH